MPFDDGSARQHARLIGVAELRPEIVVDRADTACPRAIGCPGIAGKPIAAFVFAHERAVRERRISALRHRVRRFVTHATVVR